MVTPNTTSELTKRILSAVILAPIVIFMAWLGGVFFGLMMTVIAVLMYWEWTVMTQRSILLPRDIFGVLCVLVLVIAGYVGGTTTPILFSFVAIVIGFIVIAFAKNKLGWTIAGVGVGSSLATCLIYLRGIEPSGIGLLLFLCFSVWAADIFAYIVGRTVGGPKLMPRVSPKKTWSGFLGGAAGAVIIGALVASYLFEASTVLFAGLAFITALAAQVGDLLESHIKRRFNVKDSSNLIPGHGGILDRVDGLVLSAYVFVACYVLGVAQF
ncbi:MAG: phosphatidate cytidylyltransferase [Hyphomicrobiales bacterium]